MPDTTTAAATPRPSRSAPKPAKTPPAQLARFAIDADHCPQVLLRILGLMARDGTVPVTIAVTREADMLRIAIELDGATLQRCETLLAQIDAMPAVRDAQLVSAGPTSTHPAST